MSAAGPKNDAIIEAKHVDEALKPLKPMTKPILREYFREQIRSACDSSLFL